MLYQYYFKRLKLFNLPYKILLSYHAPAGNTLKHWTFYQMLPHIVAVRKEIHILSMTFTVILLRKALNILFQRINTRGTFLIHAQASKGLRMNHAAVFTFVTQWLPGILTNYKRVIRSIKRHKTYSHILNFYLKRPQLDSVDNIALNPKPIAKKRKRTRRRTVPALPSVSLSLTDCDIWLNETNCLKIPSIQICDTQSQIQKVSYPIVANQRSVSFNYLLLTLFAETCNFSLSFEHLFFLSVYKQLHDKRNIKKAFTLKSRVKRTLRQSYSQIDDQIIHLKSTFKQILKKKTKNFKVQKGKLMREYKLVDLVKAPIIFNKKTFIFNKRFFAYQIRDIVAYKASKKNLVNSSFSFINLLKFLIFNTITSLKKKLLFFEKLLKKKRKYRGYFSRSNKSRKRRFKHRRKIFANIFFMRRIIKKLYRKIFGLSKALLLKYYQKVPYITHINIKSKNISNKFLCGFLYEPAFFFFLNQFYKRQQQKKKKNFKIKWQSVTDLTLL